MTLTIIILAAFAAGTLVGFIAASFCAIAKDADDYEPIEHEPEPRVMPRIWDGFNRKENT